MPKTTKRMPPRRIRKQNTTLRTTVDRDGGQSYSRGNTRSQRSRTRAEAWSEVRELGSSSTSRSATRRFADRMFPLFNTTRAPTTSPRPQRRRNRTRKKR